MRPYLLFDFDGTIANSIDLIYDILNGFAPDYKMEPVSKEDFDVIRSMDPRTAMNLFPVPFYRIPFIITRVLREYHQRMGMLRPYDGIEDMLRELKADHIPMALLSSNNIRNVTRFLDQHDLNFFTWTEGTGGVMRKHNRIARKLRQYRIDPSRVIYIGDESRDIQAAKRCGIRVISVTWGFHTESLLQRFSPDYLISRPEELAPLIRKLSETNIERN